MAYKSNKQARAEYLDNEARNRERNRRNYERRKERETPSGGGVGRTVLIVVALFLLFQYFSHQRPNTPKAVPVSTPVSSARY